jgi:N-acetylglucosamine-6-phosphate deacetylase
MDCLIRGDLLWPDGQIRPGVVVVRGESIAEVAAGPGPAGLPVFEAPEGGVVAPGFIDLQVNGAFGHDFTIHPNLIVAVARHLPRFGVTAFLAAIVSAPLTRYLEAGAAVKALAAEPGTARVLGLHLEGPYLNAARAGGHLVPNLRRPALEELIYVDSEVVRLVTLAPELPGSLPFIRALVGQGVGVGLGHSEASYEQARAAVDQGASWGPHVFNHMSGLHHRHPGIAGLMLADDRVRVGLIADGVHLHPAVLRFVAAAKGPERVTLVSDSVAATGMGKGDYTLGSQRLVVENNAARLPAGGLAGSLITLDQAVRTMVHDAGVPLDQTLQMASTTPARVAGESKRGALRPGYQADLVILDQNLEVSRTIIAGEVAYEREALLQPAGAG